MEYAVDCGINIFDAAEIYPVPPKAETQGRTESIIGTWLARRKKRDQILIATKIVGRFDWLREERSPTRQSPVQIREAVEASLKRLRTDYIDLYQLHWPDRPDARVPWARIRAHRRRHSPHPTYPRHASQAGVGGQGTLGGPLERDAPGG